MRNHDVEGLNKIVADVRAAYQLMADFLTTQVRVTSSMAVPYANQMTLLAEVFRRVSHPSHSQYRAILRWFWRTSLTAYFAGWNTAQMAADLNAVKAFAGGTDEIHFEAGLPSPDIWKGKFSTKTAYTKLLALTLSHQSPVDLLTGQHIDTSKALAWSNAKEFHHFFPKDFLKKRGFKSDKINMLANFIMLTSASNKTISGRAPSDYLRDVAKEAGPHLDEWLDTNLISTDAYSAALADNYEGFIEARAKSLHQHVLDKAHWPSNVHSVQELNSTDVA